MEAVLSMRALKDVSSLKSFLASVQLYAKFYLPLTQPKRNLGIYKEASRLDMGTSKGEGFSVTQEAFVEQSSSHPLQP